MSEHPRVLVEAARLQVMAVEERVGVQRRGFRFGVRSREMDWVARQRVEDQEQMSEIDGLAR